MRKTLGILAHVDAGKTTLSERILYGTHEVRSFGTVDCGNTVMDFHDVEKARGITVFSATGRFDHGGDEYSLIDTPGHTDFSPEAERAVSVLDAAVITICAVEGVKPHTQTLFGLARKLNKPVFFFINKADRDIAEPERVMKELRKYFGNGCLDFTEPLSEGNREYIAQTDDCLLEKYLSDTATEDDFSAAVVKSVTEGKIFPVYRGSALNGNGVEELLCGFDRFLRTEYDDEAPLKIKIFKTGNHNGDRLSYAKILSGRLRVRDMLGEDKISALKVFTGCKSTDIREAYAGQIVCACGLKNAKTGDVLTCEGQADSENVSELMPVMKSRVVFTDGTDIHEGAGLLRVLEDEEPTLEVETENGELNVKIMGEIQTEILTDEISERFGKKVEFEPAKIIYRESIKNTVLGIGHYEPLRHYAEVILRLSPGERGSGITYESGVSSDILATPRQRLIETHIFEKKHRGVLCGAVIDDIHIELVAGRDHIKHTEGGDFRQSVYRAIRHGLRRAESVLLEPVYEFTIYAPTEFCGRIISDITAMCGTCDVPENEGGMGIIRGKCPVSEMAGYSRILSAFTKGKGRISVRVSGYEECHNPEEVLAENPYNPDADEENPCGSVFCAKGAGFFVPWNEVEGYSHLLGEL